MKQKISALFMIVIGVLMLFAVAPARAQVNKGVELKSVAETDIVVTNAKGEKETKRIEVTKGNVTPGDTVIFTTYYVNNGDNPVSGTAIKNPVPLHTVYLDGTAGGEGATIEFSVDNGKSYGLPKSLKVTDADGKERPAKASDYTHIRWTFNDPLNAGAKGSVFFNAKIK